MLDCDPMARRAKLIVELLIGAAFAVVILQAHKFSAGRAMFHFSRAMYVSIAIWCLFSIYWSIAAKKSADSQSSESMGSRQFHVVMVNLCLLLLVVAVPGLTQRFMPAGRAISAAGLALQLAALGFAIWARKHLGRNWSGEVRIAAGHQLVRTGPYRLIRHPIYTALLGMYLGTMVVSGQVHALLAVVIVCLTYWRKIRMEEKVLAENFGEEFGEYRRRSWALVPYVV